MHELVEQLRLVDNVADLPTAKLRDLDAGCTAIWKARRQIAGPDIGSAESTSVRIDLLDLALLWTGLIVRISPDEKGRGQAIDLLDQAQELCGPSPVLVRAKAQLARSSGSQRATTRAGGDPAANGVGAQRGWSQPDAARPA